MNMRVIAILLALGVVGVLLFSLKRRPPQDDSPPAQTAPAAAAAAAIAAREGL